MKVKTRLNLGKVAYRNVGVNIPDLFERFLRGEDASGVQALADARGAGVHLARCWGTTWSAAGFGAFETNREGWLNAFDRMLEAADNADMAIVPSLLFNVNMLREYVGRANGKPESLSQYLTPGTRSNDLALEYVTAIVTRYKNDPRVLFWEIGNEYNLEADLSTKVNNRAPGDVVTSDQVRAFLAQIAARIHSLDKKHYVTSGNGDMRPSALHLREAMLAGRNAGHALDFTPDWTSDTFAEYQQIFGFFNPPNVDILSAHQYPPDKPDTATYNGGASWLVEDGLHALRMPWTQYAADSLKKPLFIGEVGQKVVAGGKEQAAPWLLDYLRRAQTSDAPLVALWSWEYDPNNPTQAPFSLSPTRTPQILLALNTANSALLNAAVNNITVVRPPTLDVNKTVQQTAQQADHLTAQSEKLLAIAKTTLAAARTTIAGREGTGNRAQVTGDREQGTAEKPSTKSSSPNTQYPTPNILTVRLPDGGQTQKVFSIRDAALMLGPDLIAADEVAGWARLVASTQAGPDGLKLANGLSVPPYSIPDHLTLSGEPCWFPGAGAGYDQGDGKFGFLPPADNPFYFIQMVREHLRQTGNGALLGSQVKTAWGTETVAEACTRAFDSVEVDANGLVVVGNGPTDWRVDWGFADTVHKTGACLMPSVLRWRAAKDLVLLFAALNDRTQIAKYDQIARDLPLAIANAFYHPLDKENGKDVGMLYSATGQGHKDDIWASAYAVAIGAVRTRTAVAVAQHLRIVYQAGGTVVEGHVRPLLPSGPYGGYWEQTSTPPDTYQNGAYWGFPAGWYIAALMRVDRPAAEQMLDEFVQSLQTRQAAGAPWQCLYPAKQYARLPQYCASVTAPYAALRAALNPQ